jgi:hypothetical protein
LPCFLSSSSFTLPSLFHSPPRSLITGTTPSQASKSKKKHTHTHKHIQTQNFFLNPSFALDRFLKSRVIHSVPPMGAISRTWAQSSLVLHATHELKY